MPDALPHTQNIIHKSTGVGIEFKNLADGVTGVILRLESRRRRLIWQSKTGQQLPAGTAWLLTCRHCKPYLGSHRIVRADFAFTSTTAAVLKWKRGLFLQDVMKRATKQFPAKYQDSC